MLKIFYFLKKLIVWGTGAIAKKSLISGYEVFREWKMFKEMVICILSIAIILIGNNVTYSYATESINEMSNKLNKVREATTKEEVNKEESIGNMDEVYNYWFSRYNTLAYFVEHDELEKVQTSLSETKSNIEMEQYEEAVVQLDSAVFILNHIESKLAFKVENIL